MFLNIRIVSFFFHYVSKRIIYFYFLNISLPSLSRPIILGVTFKLFELLFLEYLVVMTFQNDANETEVNNNMANQNIIDILISFILLTVSMVFVAIINIKDTVLPIKIEIFFIS